MEILIGLCLIALTYFVYGRLKPHGRPVYAFMKREVIAASVTLSLVAGLTFGLAMFIHGVTRLV